MGAGSAADARVALAMTAGAHEAAELSTAGPPANAPRFPGVTVPVPDARG